MAHENADALYRTIHQASVEQCIQCHQRGFTSRRETVDACQASCDQLIGVQLCDIIPVGENDVTIVKSVYTGNVNSVTTRAQRQHEIDAASVQTTLPHQIAIVNNR